jgi:hypothetical protein
MRSVQAIIDQAKEWVQQPKPVRDSGLALLVEVHLRHRSTDGSHVTTRLCRCTGKRVTC